MPKLYRKQPDSSGITCPRVLARVFAEPGQFERTVRYYEKLTLASLDMDLDGRDLGIRIAAVAGFLILELDPTEGERVKQATKTKVTMVFADLDAAVETGLALGAELITAAFSSPVGRGALLRHPDGLIVEYLEHRPGAYDVETSSL